MRSAAKILFSLLCVICLSICSVFSGAQTPSSAPSSPEDQVTKLENDWLAADGTGNINSLNRVIADDFIGSSFDGRVLNKEDIVPQGGAPGGFAGAKPSDNTVRVFGDTAVLMGVIDTAQSKRIHVTLVCQKRAQGWQIIAAELTRI